MTRPGDSQTLPYSERFLQDFEYRYCYDRYWEERGEHDWSDTRFMCNGHAFTVSATPRSLSSPIPRTACSASSGISTFCSCLIAHLHKAALLMLSDRLGGRAQPPGHPPARVGPGFKRSIRQTMEIFLRFTHRYWFNPCPTRRRRAICSRCGRVIWAPEALYSRRDGEIQDMTHYLDSDQLRRQADTVVRLTVVTTFGLIGTVATGFLGMNLIAEADNPLSHQDRLLPAGVHSDRGSDALHHREVEAAVRVPRSPVRRASAAAGQAQHPAQRMETEEGRAERRRLSRPADSR